MFDIFLCGRWLELVVGLILLVVLLLIVVVMIWCLWCVD